MKKYFLITLIIAFTAQINAQSNLIFNQVINESLPIGAQITVPVGKVWKITMMNNNVKINGLETYWNSHKITTPVWLGEGDIIEGLTSPNPILSIIEFNVVPTSITTGGSGGGVSADGFTAIGIVNIQFNDSTAGIDNHLMGTITVPEGEIWKITDASILHSSLAFGSYNNGGNYVLSSITYTFIGNHQFPTPNGGNNRPARYLTEGSYEVRSWDSNGLVSSPTSAPVYYQAMINGIKYSAN